MGHVNLQRLDLASIRLVVLCAEWGSLSEAAKRSHLSVSGASHRLKSFEDAVGYPVFQRHRRGLRVTDRGAHTVYCSRQLLSWVEELRAATHEVAVATEVQVSRGGVVEGGSTPHVSSRA